MKSKICLHDNVEKEVVMGCRTGDRICVDCGAVFLSAEELHKARAEARALLQSQTQKEVSEPN